MRHIALGDTKIRDTSRDVFHRFLRRRLLAGKTTLVFFANANFVVKCRHLAGRLGVDPECFVLNDGVAVQIAARLRRRHAFRDNLNGTDFIPEFLARAPVPVSVYLLGSAPGTVARAASVLERLPNVRVVGIQDGFSLWSDEAALDRISNARPDVLIVGLGNPLQEEWILKFRPRLDVPVTFAAGALFEFLSGDKPRAPPVLRTLRLEWAFRLSLEPRRLFKRYTFDMARFFGLVLLSR